MRTIINESKSDFAETIKDVLIYFGFDKSKSVEFIKDDSKLTVVDLDKSVCNAVLILINEKLSNIYSDYKGLCLNETFDTIWNYNSNI